MRLYTLDGDRGTFVSEHELTPVSLPLEGAVHVHEDRSAHVHEGPAATVFVASAELTRAGDWGAELAVTLNDGEAERLRMRLIVLERTREPMLGEPAPRSVQRVLRDVDDISEIDTSNPPMPELHELTVAEAVDRGRPVLVALATPAFCQTRFCGPVVDTVMRPLHERYRGEVEFVHIEPFDVAAARGGRLELVPAMAEWGLTTEPWIFVIDGSGRVRREVRGHHLRAGGRGCAGAAGGQRPMTAPRRRSERPRGSRYSLRAASSASSICGWMKS